MNKKLWLLGAALAMGTTFAAVPNNTLLIMSSSDIPTLDPAQAYDTASSEPIENMYESLVGYNGKSITDVKPLLATSWKLSTDGKTFTFDLRKGVKFHSGNAFTCDDAEYTMKRLLVTNNSDSPAWFMAQSLLGFAYWDDDTKKSVTWGQIDNAVQCNASGQLVFKLAKRDPAFLSKLLYTATSIVDKKNAIAIGEWSGTEKDWKDWIEKDLNESALNKKPSGTGAYQLVSRDAGKAVFKAFDGYWGGKPKIEFVIIQKVDETATRIEALKKGDADLVGVGQRANLDQVKGAAGVKILDNLPNNITGAIFMNQKIVDPKVLGSGKFDGKGIPANFFADVNVRKGFSYAFNAKQYIDEVLLGKGAQISMALPSNYLGYDAKIPNYNFDPEKATLFLKKAFNGQLWANGFQIDMNYRANSLTSQKALEILKTNLEKLNPKFKLNLSAKPWSELLKDADSSKLPMVLGNWIPDYPDSDNVIRTFYHSQDGAFKGRLNFKDETIDTLIDQAYSTSDSAARATIYKQVGRRAYDLAPFILLPTAVPFLTLRDNIKGVEENYNIQTSGSFGTYWKNLSK
jgi:peptide/nickel transport system substrate-binding protein